MNIREELIILFAFIIVISIGLTSYFSIQYTESAVINSELEVMRSQVTERSNEIELLHARASGDLVFAVQNPAFVEYFELPDTQAGNVYDKNYVMQFTPEQQVIKDELDKWIFNFQDKFTVDETCLIDSMGQEHTRLTFQEIASDDDLSSEEAAAPFFEPSFMLEQGQVHLQFPYVSPDSERWVFAYTTPIVTSDGSIPAFYHFEMPITVFQELVDIEVGRMYVIDPDGFIIADSHNASVANAKYNVNPQTISSFDPREYFPSIQTVSASTEYGKLFDRMIVDKNGFDKYLENGEEYFVVYQTLPTFGWIVAYEMPVSLMLLGDTTLSNLSNTIIFVAIGISAIGFITAVIISNKITSPIRKLSKIISAQNPECLESIHVDTKSEMKYVIVALNSMIKKIAKTQEEIHMQNAEIKIQQKRSIRLAEVGEIASRLTHNLRDPLTVINSSIDLLRIKSKDSLDGKTLQYLDAISNSSANMIKQVEEVLDFVRDKPIDKQKIALSTIIDAAIGNIIVPQGVKIIMPKTDLELECDHSKLEVVFMNLMTNSIQAMDDIGLITIISYITEKELVIEFQDDGPGIATDKLENIFDSLYTTKPTGTGLGLGYCKSVIEQHGGSISVSTCPTKFTMILPVMKITKKVDFDI